MMSSSSPWLICHKENQHARLRLVCIPYAGGSSQIFRTWPDGLPARVEVWSTQFPGRGIRLKEAPYTRLEPLVEVLKEALIPILDKPFALFGHSMGALIGFELARMLRRQAVNFPVHLFLSACSAPQLENPEPPVAYLPEVEFLDRLRALNGTPPQVLEERELLQLLLPTLRADFAAFESYEFKPEAPLDCPITVFGGLKDARIERGRLEAWQVQTQGPFQVRMFPGDHFFIHSAQALLLRAISQSLDLR